MSTFVGKMKRAMGGKSHRWIAVVREGSFDAMRSPCGLEERRAFIWEPKYAHAPTCAKCANKESSTNCSK